MRRKSMINLRSKKKYRRNRLLSYKKSVKYYIFLMILGLSFLSCFQAERTNPDDPQNPDSFWNIVDILVSSNNGIIRSSDTYTFSSVNANSQGQPVDFKIRYIGTDSLSINAVLLNGLETAGIRKTRLMKKIIYCYVYLCLCSFHVWK